MKLLEFFNSVHKTSVFMNFEQKSEQLNEAAGISSYEAAELIAQDDELFDAVASYTTWPDVFDEHPEELSKLLNILRQVKPFRKRLYRGEKEFEFNNYQPYSDHIERGFTSWSLSKEVAQKWFNERGNVVKYTDGPVKAVSVADIADARMRSHPDESHYGGGQAEVLVLEPVERKVEGIYESIGKTLMETFAKDDVDNLFWFWSHPATGRIHHIDTGTHTLAAIDPDSPIPLTPDDFGGYDMIDIDDFDVFRAAFSRGWVRSSYMVAEGAHPLGNQVALHGPDQETVEMTLKMLLDAGLDVDYVGMRGEFDGFEYDGPLEDL